MIGDFLDWTGRQDPAAVLSVAAAIVVWAAVILEFRRVR